MVEDHPFPWREAPYCSASTFLQDLVTQRMLSNQHVPAQQPWSSPQPPWRLRLFWWFSSTHSICRSLARFQSPCPTPSSHLVVFSQNYRTLPIFETVHTNQILVLPGHVLGRPCFCWFLNFNYLKAQLDSEAPEESTIFMGYMDYMYSLRPL